MTAFYEKTEQSGFTIMGIDVKTSNENDQAVDDINALWQRFYEENLQEKITDRKDDVIYAVYTDYEGDHTKPYRVIIGYQVDDNAKARDGMVTHTVPTATYGSFRARGQQPQALIQTWESIWGAELERSYQSDYEVYGPKFMEPGLHEVIINIGLKGS